MSTTATPLTSFSQNLAEIIERAAPGVVGVRAGRSHATAGVAVRADLVLTAAHAIRREHGIVIVRAEGQAEPARLAGIDPTLDIAVLGVDSAPALAFAPFAPAAGVRAGHFVTALARSVDGTLVASAGIVARSAGPWRTWRGAEVEHLIQLDGALWRGFSGAVALDSAGTPLGMCTSGLARGRGIVLPGVTLERAIERVISGKAASQPFLGIAAHAVAIPESLRARLDSPQPQGLVVLSTVQGGPADEAGVLLGDVLTSLETTTLVEVDDLRRALGKAGPDARVRLGLLRGGEPRTLEVRVADRPR
jgi:S1-C subfamily serine protease